MIGRINVTKAFQLCKSNEKTAVIPFICSGYPTRSHTVDLLLAMQEGGAALIEVGVPFSDPTADGPTIQKCHHIAILQGVTLTETLNMIKEARERGLHIPVILMGYLNPFLAYGLRKLCEDGKKVGVDGFIVVDLPLEEAVEFLEYIDEFDLCFIPLVSPTTTDHRLELIAKAARGYVYCVSVTGVTGARDSLPSYLESYFKKIRNFISLPLGLGFGIGTREHVLETGKYADAAIIGSQLVCQMEKSPDRDVQSVLDYILYLNGNKKEN